MLVTVSLFARPEAGKTQVSLDVIDMFARSEAGKSLVDHLFARSVAGKSQIRGLPAGGRCPHSWLLGLSGTCVVYQR